MSSGSWPNHPRRRGFTLIEVVGALVIFSVGVLMVIQVSGAIGTQMRYAGIKSEIVVRSNQILDSLGAPPSDSLTAGTTYASYTVGGLAYEEEVIITEVTAVLAQINVWIRPAGPVGPSHTITGYTSTVW